MEKEREYYLGIDMGTNSVGWAVTDPAYHILRAKGKDLWGVRLFDRAETAAERRTYRVARRRRARETARIGILRQLFAEEIEKVDPGFFARLDESKFYLEDRGEQNKQKYAIFADKNYTDQDYYRDYPTIFHLRKQLLESTEPKDVRLLYLALANMYKHRGHFLNHSLSTEGGEGSLKEAYEAFLEIAGTFELSFPAMESVADDMEEILSGSGSRKKKAECLSEIFGIGKKQKTEYQIVQMMCGLKGKIAEIFKTTELDEEHKKLAVSFRDSDYEEKEVELQILLSDDDMELLAAIKAVHDSAILSGLMKGYRYLSQARVASYEKHHKDLGVLKDVLKNYDRKAYYEMFRDEKAKNSYSAYVGSVNHKTTKTVSGRVRRGMEGKTQEDLYKNIKKILAKFPQEDAQVQYILTEIEQENFLPKQLTAENGVIPNQVHAREMRKILQNAENYLPFLKEKDDVGPSASDKILQLFTFQIPYYVGPLGQSLQGVQGSHAWSVRKAPGKIYPWNFSEKIDEKKSAERFIERMVRHCTYLTGETALPKQSLLYEKFQVLNELNNLRIYGERVSVEVKQTIYHELFEKGKKVSMLQLQKYLIKEGLVKPQDIESAISGIDGGFQNSLSSIGKFKGVFGEDVFLDKNQKMIEDIIFWGTVFGDDRKFLRENLEEHYGSVLNDAQKKRICGFKFSGWGRLSRAFLTMEGASKEEGDGEIKGLIQSMWDTPCNLMELLSDRFTYKDSLNEMVHLAEKPLEEWQIEDLDEMYLSAPVKRMVWQTLRILDEIQNVFGCPPKKIFVEMAREEGEKGKRTVSRKKKLQALYQALGKEEKSLREALEATPEQQFSIKKLYLYYQQKGRCMYTDEEIDPDQLMNNNLYDIDHIYPRHFIKDDNIENNLVLVKKEENAHKKDVFPIEPEIRKRMLTKWKILRKQNFLSEEKYNRLTRSTAFTDEEKARFISRQLVETRQGTKAITQILHQAFQESDIIFSRASEVSEFRRKFKCYKVRCINDYHHAQDAYLNIVVGNVYDVKFTKNPLNFIKEARKHPDSAENRYNMDKMFERDVTRNGVQAWVASNETQPGTIAVVKKYLKKHSPLVTKMAYENSGGITRKATIWSKEKAKANPSAYFPIKTSDPRLADVTKYGGPMAITVAGYTLLEYQVGGKTVRSLEALPVYLGPSNELSEEQLLAYFTQVLTAENKKKQVTNVHICKKMIPQKSLVKYDGFYYYLGGKTGNQIILTNAVQLCLPASDIYYAKKVEKAVAKEDYQEKDKNGKCIISKERNIEMYDTLLNKYRDSIYKYMRGTMAKNVEDGFETYQNLELPEQCKVLMQIFLNFQTGNAVDLRLIGGGPTTGKMLISKKLSGIKEFILIEQSPAGLFCKETDLLSIV